MNFFKQYGKWTAIVFILTGTLLVIFSFSISLQPALVQIWLDGRDELFLIQTQSSLVANWLGEAGIRLFPHDSVRVSGMAIPHDFSYTGNGGRQVLYKPAVPISLNIDGETHTFYSGADTLAEALWDQGIILKRADHIDPAPETTLDRALNVTLQRSQPLTITSGGNNYRILTAARNVGDALAEAGFAIQNLDYSEPDADTQIPEDRIIKVVRVQEEVFTEETSIPYATERVSDPNMNVGEEQLMQSGVNGVQSSTIRVRIEDGEEVERTVLSQWVSQAPVPERVAYGGNVVEMTFDSPDGTVNYWLEMNVRVTTYHDTGNPTASGIWPYYGVIAVSPDWYSILKGTSIYVPGYGVGTVLDVCPGCAGEPWIDVFIPIDQYEAWSKNLTVYFLPPAPDSFTGELP